MSVEYTNSSNIHPRPIRQNSSTHTLPPRTPYVSRLNSISTHSHPRMHRGIYSTSSECNTSTTSSVTLNDEAETKIPFEQETVRRNVNASVQFESDASELLPNGSSSLNVVKPSMGGSSTSLRTLHIWGLRGYFLVQKWSKRWGYPFSKSPNSARSNSLLQPAPAIPRPTTESWLLGFRFLN